MRRELLQRDSENLTDGRVHVAYAADVDVINGLKASIASCIASSASPSELMIHVMVQNKHLERLQRELDIKSTQKTTSAGAAAGTG